LESVTPDPSDPGPPITVWLERVPLGDLGNARVDSRLLMAMLLRRGQVAQWLAGRGVDRAAVEKGFPELAAWPLEPPLSWPRPVPDPSDPASRIGVELDRLKLGHLGDADADARLLWAIVVRAGRVGAWLRGLGVDAAAIEAAFPGCGWG
jgi:hypothetical protein